MTDQLLPTAVTAVSLKDLAVGHQLRFHGDPSDQRVTGVVADNRRIKGGELFVARAGQRVHAARFSDDAAARGAVAILTDDAGVSAATATGLPVLLADNPEASLAAVAADVYGHPATKLRSFAVTGTNGKTTTSYMINHILRGLGRTTGLIGTVETLIGEVAVPATLTTPQPDELHATLAAMVEAGVEDLIMEVSSHALVQGRVDPIVFDVAGFTQLTPEHLDFHVDEDDYFAAKADLFTAARSQHAVITADDDWGRQLATIATPAVSVATVSTRSAGATYRVTAPGGGQPQEGHDWQLHCPGNQTMTSHTALPGGFNIANAALALAMIHHAGAATDALTPRPGLPHLDDVARAGVSPTVPGRMEVLASAPRVIVDFAHNTDALSQALSALQASTTGRLICVTGSAGDRDKIKRPHMGRVAAELGDMLIVTDDDPHDEDPGQIRGEIIAGARAVDGAEVIEIGDRADAIRYSIAIADPTDTVVLAGRGHETIQEIRGVNHHLDDREIAREALATREARQRQAEERP